MQHHTAFHLGLHCLQKNLFRGFPEYKGLKYRVTGLDKQKCSVFSYPSILTYVLGAQKNPVIEMVLLSIHNICFGLEIRKLNFSLPTLN